MSPSNKDLSKSVQSILKSLGHEISLGHAYELLAKLNGFASWNVASSKSVDLAQILGRDFHQPVSTGDGAAIANKIQGLFTGKPNKLRQFEIEVKTETTVFKDYRVMAEDATEARAIVNEYLQIRAGSIEETDAKFEQTKRLCEIEDESAFGYDNWGVEGISLECEAGQVRDLTRAEEQGNGHPFGEEYMTIDAPLAERLRKPGVRYCYWITEESKDEAGFVPVLVIENDTGYYPMRGLIAEADLRDAKAVGHMPWHWGKTEEEAMRVCDKVNKDKFKLSHEQAEEIYDSTIRAAIKKHKRDESRDRAKQ
jgi:hypothetical protein